MSTLASPAHLRAESALDPQLSAKIAQHRGVIADVLTGEDPRLLVIAGPCSVHDTDDMLEYAAGLSEVASRFADDVYVVARVYAEKPRTRHGWPGLLLDPGLDGSFDVVRGLASTRQIMSEVNALGLPVATEFVEPQLTPYLSDLVSWAGIGARTVESPPHRRLASQLDLPVGFKNRVDGAVAPAVDAIAVASRPQPTVSLDEHGRSAWHRSEGNPHAHLVLRGGDGGTNYDAHQINHALGALAAVKETPRLIVDCSHGNSGKDYRRQPLVAEAVAAQIGAGQKGIAGVMLESFRNPGAQAITGSLRPGVSVTDACLGFEETVEVIASLARASSRRSSYHRAELVNAR